MAEEQYHDLSTDTKRVEYFNQKVKEFKDKDPELSSLSPEAFGVARQYAQGIVFPMGLTAFPDKPGEKPKDESDLESYAKKIIQGSVHFTKKLKGYEPSNLISYGIENFRGFNDSRAANDVLAATKMSFEQTRSGLEDLKDSMTTGEEVADDPFGGKAAFKKLSPDDIEAMLGLTVLKFVKELGIARDAEAEQRDKYFFERGQKALDLAAASANTQTATTVTTPANKLNTSEDPEYLARLEKSKREDDLATSLITSKSGAKVVQEKPTVKEQVKIEEAIKPATPTAQTPATTTTTTPAPTVVEQAQAPVTKVENNLEKEEIPATPATPATPSAAPATNVVEQAQPSIVPATENIASNFKDNPFIMDLGKSLGLSDADMQDVFGGSGASEISAGLKSGVTGDLTNVSASVVKEVTGEQIKTPEPAPATKISEPTKIATPAPAATTPAPPPAVQEKSQVSEPEKTPAETTPPAPAPSTEEKKEETKAAEETKKEEDKTNAELLKVMKDILRTLQGPLITTDGTHKFH